MVISLPGEEFVLLKERIQTLVRKLVCAVCKAAIMVPAHLKRYVIL